MKTSFGILKRDLLALLRNPIALLVVGALLVLPGLYAWYCIIANWDPYAHTGNMPIAVVNLDRAATSELTGEIDVGAQVSEKLEDNDSIDWRFYDDEREALEDTRLGNVYATLVIPEDLSENIIGIFEGSLETPTIYYYPNEKYNAVATKVCDSAAQTLVRQINQNFSSTVNKTILASTQNIADEVEARADQVNQSAIAQVRDIQADLVEVSGSLDDAANSIASFKEASAGADSALEAASAQLASIRALLAQGSGQLDDLRAETAEFERGLSRTVLDSAATVASLSGQASANIARSTANLELVKARLEALSDALADQPDAASFASSLSAIAGVLGHALDAANERLTAVNDDVQSTTGSIRTATGRVSGEIAPQLDAGTYSLVTSLSKLSGAVGQFEPQVGQLRLVLSQTDDALADAQVAIADTKTLLDVISANLKGTVADIGAIGRALEIDQLSDLLDVEPGKVGTFISSPVHMVTEKIYPVPNYGTAVAPFYTNLALWIGCFILVSLMKLEVDRKDFESATPTQRYFGRWLLLVLLAVMQSQVICGVDILLGIDCQDPGYFMMAGFVCSLAYMNIIFALVITFRNIGKTLCILLLIMQVPGSSGMYPIEMMPQFFQFIHPALPFTYGIDAMREALSGMYGDRFLYDLSFLLLTVPVSLLLGVAIRPALSNLTLLFDREMSATGFFASEIHGQANPDRLKKLMRVLGSSDETRDEMEERAWRFNRVYPRLRRVGTVAIMAIPFFYLLIVLPFNLGGDIDINAKLTTLLLMIVVLLVVQAALIVLEYVHRSVAEQTRLMGLQILNDSGLTEDSDAAVDLIGRLLSENDAPAHEQDSGIRPLKTGPAPFAGPAWDIFSTDLRLGFRSVIGVVVIMLLVITPSMYAWFNIAGSWNPYGATGNLKVAVANEDAGYKGELIPVTINIGDTVVSQLRGNSSFDWIFVTKDEATAGVESGSYYAAIEIPSDFSTNMMTYLTAETDYPDVIYYTNEKENPIAPIITQKGADSIQENIRVSFTERVDEVVLSVAYDVLNYVTNPRMSSYVAAMSGHLDDALGDTVSAARQIRALGGLANTSVAIVETTGTTIDGLKAAVASAKGAMGDARSGLADATSAFGQAGSAVKEMFENRSVDVDGIREKLDAALDLLAAGTADVAPLIEGIIDDVQALARDSEGATAEFDAVIASLEQARDHVQGASGRISSAHGDVDRLVSQARSELAEAKDFFENTVSPSLSRLRATMRAVASSTSQVSAGVESAASGIAGSTDGLASQLTALAGGLTQAADKLERSAGRIDDTKKRIAEALKSGNVRQIEAVILGGDPETMATSLAEPVQQHREALYPVANYGSSMAPFYTVLSLWVGALVMISTMRVHVVEQRMDQLRRRFEKIRPRHEFFGRYGIFGFIGLLQSALVLLGDLLLLDIQCVNPVLFFVFGLFIGQVFCLVVYTLTELFGDVGKALCVILLIMQVAASGGTFPAEMLDPLLEDIVPFLPFYSAMRLLQECVAGIEWAHVPLYVAALLAWVGVMLLAGVPLRKPFRKINDFFEEQLEKTGYM